MKRLISSCVLALSGTVFLSSGAMAADAASCQNVRLGVVNWTDVIATSAMAQVLLDGLGYKTKQTSASQQIIFAGIRDQRLDLFLGYWNPLMTQTITPFVDAKQVKVLAEPSLKDARATLAVPTYLADKGLKTFADIAKFEKELGGKIYGIEPGSGANTQIKAMITKNQFGLGKFQLVESSEAGMLAAVDRAVRRKGSRGVLRLGAAPDERQCADDLPHRQRRRPGPKRRHGHGVDRHRADLRRTVPERQPAAEQPDVQRRGREPHDAAAARPQGRPGVGQAMAGRPSAGQGALARRGHHLRWQPAAGNLKLTSQ